MPTCYRHPQRETGRACTRCGRPACADCLIQASVGSQCVECVRGSATPRSDRVLRWWKGQRLIVTPAIIGITVAAYVVLGAIDGRVDGRGPRSFDFAVNGPDVADGEWWRLLTSGLVHYSLLHLAFNMFILYQVGQVLEPAAGRLRFALLYVVSIVGGSAGAILAEPNAFTGGASGGVFGVAAAATLALHRRGIPFWQTGFGPLLAINLALTFLLPNVSIGGHIGGLAAGLVAGEVMLQARRVERPWIGVAGTLAVGLAAAALALSAA